jgi:SecD/SecF fusion protein
MINKKVISAGIIVAFIFTTCTLSCRKELENKFLVRVSTDKFLLSLSNNSKDEKFLEALNVANDMQRADSESYVTLFGKAFNKVNPNANLANIFNNMSLRKDINFESTNEEVLGVLQKQMDQAINKTINILKTRIDRYGIRHQNVQRVGNSENILIELPEVENIKRVKELIITRAKLEFRETYENPEVFQYLEEANKKIKEIKETREKIVKDTTQKMAQKYPLFTILRPMANSNGQLINSPVVGVAHFNDTAQVNHYLQMKKIRSVLPRDLEFHWGVKPYDDNEEFFPLYAIKKTGRDGKAPLTGDVVKDANAQFGRNRASAKVSMSMDSDGAKIWARLTKNNVQEFIAILLDGYVYSAPRVNQEITGGQSSITGDFTLEEAQDLANVLNSGKLPAPVRIIEENL